MCFGIFPIFDQPKNSSTCASIMKITLHFSFNFSFLVLLLLPNIIQSDPQDDVSQTQTSNYYQIDLPQVIGPESIAFDCKNEGPYVGVSDGRILKWEGTNHGWTEFAVPSPDRDRKLCDGSVDPNHEPTCGRPLGLKFSKATCQLFIADAYFGLLMVGPNGGVAQQLANSAEGIPFRLTNALDIDFNTGVIYFTDSSNNFQRRNIMLSVLTMDKSGRLLKYDPQTKNLTVMYKGLAFPNGVALSKDNSFLLVAESIRMRILKFNCDGVGNKFDVPQVFAQLMRVPDNIKRNENGEFWVALNSGRGRIQSGPLTKLVGKAAVPWLNQLDPIGIKFDGEGKVVKKLDGNGESTFNSVSEIEEINGKLYIGSVVKPYVAVLHYT